MERSYETMKRRRRVSHPAKWPPRRPGDALRMSSAMAQGPGRRLKATLSIHFSTGRPRSSDSESQTIGGVPEG